MPDEFDLATFVSEQFNAAGEDPGHVPAAPQDQASIDSGTPTDNAQATGEGTAQQGPDGQDGQGAESPFNWEQFTAQHPELVPLAKQFQGDYTRKMQELATERQQYESYAALDRLAQEDPARYAQVVQQWAASLAGGGQADPGVETDPYAEYVPATELEGVLLEKVRALEAKGQQWEQFQAQQQQAQAWAAHEARIAAEYQQIKTLAGRDLTEAEVVQLADHCKQRGIANTVAGYRDLHFDALMQSAMQKARDEASAVVQQKLALPGTPSALVARTAGTVELPKDPRQRIEHLVRETMAELSG
jgi:hypothetical protein